MASSSNNAIDFNRVVDVFKNMGDNESGLPSSDEMFAGIDVAHSIALGSALVANVCSIGISVVQLYYLLNYTSSENLRTAVSFIIMIIPVVAINSSVSLCVPRSAYFLYAVMFIYFTVCLFIIVKVMYAMFGNRGEMLRYMKNNDKRFNLTVYPFPLKLLKNKIPTVEGTSRNVRIFEMMIAQTLIYRVISMAAEMVVFLELRHRKHAFYTISQLIGMLSMWTAFYGVYVLIDIGITRLKPYRFNVMFAIFDWSQTIVSIEKILADVFMALQWIQPTDWMSPSGFAMLYLNVAISWQFLFLNIFISFYFYPSRTILFDQYGEWAHIRQSASLTFDETKEQARLLSKAHEIRPEPIHPNKTKKEEEPKSNSKKESSEQHEIQAKASTDTDPEHPANSKTANDWSNEEKKEAEQPKSNGNEDKKKSESREQTEKVNHESHKQSLEDDSTQ